MFFLLTFLQFHLIQSRPQSLNQGDGFWIYNVADQREGDLFSKYKISSENPFLGLLSTVKFEDLFSVAGEEFKSLPLGEYVLEIVTVKGRQILVHSQTGDRFEKLEPSGYRYEYGYYMDLQALGYTFRHGPLKAEVGHEERTSRVSSIDISGMEIVTETEMDVIDGFDTDLTLTHHLVVDGDGKYHVHWRSLESGIVIKLEVETLGFIGMGISPSGGMKGADIVIAWVDDDDGEVHLTDRHGLGNFIPPLDKNQNLELQFGYQNDTHTVVQFYREWNSCDEEDVVLVGMDTVKIIWSYFQKDELQYHTLTQRGVQFVHLKDSLLESTVLPPEYKLWDIHAGNVTIPHDDHTHYFCRLVQIPEEARHTKHQIVRVEPLIQPGNEAYVHHITLHECIVPEVFGSTASALQDSVDNPGTECYGPGMPNMWLFCRTIQHGWAIGMTGYNMPENAGFPLGEEFGGATFYKIEIHYDNQAFHEDVLDNSGLRMFYTSHVREMDAGMLMIGKAVNLQHFIPPLQSHFISTGHCPSECTKKAFPPEGITVFAAQLHSHLAGRKMRTRQIRNGVELPILVEDNNYDSNFQAVRNIPDVSILPGDTLIAECEAVSGDNPVYGGLATIDEMCLIFLHYYPTTKLLDCQSGLTFSAFLNGFGIEKLSVDSFERLLEYTYHVTPGLYNLDGNRDDIVAELSSEVILDSEVLEHLLSASFYEDFALQRKVLVKILMDIEIEMPLHLKGLTFGEVFENTNWLKRGEEMSRIFTNGEQISQCSGSDQTSLIEVQPSLIPNFTKLTNRENVCEM